MENTLKIKIFQKSILFCKYLHNGSLDPYEILDGGQLYLVSLNIKFHKDPCINARARVVNVRVHVLSQTFPKKVTHHNLLLSQEQNMQLSMDKQRK